MVAKELEIKIIPNAENRINISFNRNKSFDIKEIPGTFILSFSNVIFLNDLIPFKNVGENILLIA